MVGFIDDLCVRISQRCRGAITRVGKGAYAARTEKLGYAGMLSENTNYAGYAWVVLGRLCEGTGMLKC